MNDSEGSPAFVERVDEGVLVQLKVVPGARTAGIAGSLGDRLKVRVAAPPEGGRANEEVARTLAAAFEVPLAAVALVRGASNPRKTFRIVGEVERLVGISKAIG